MSYDPELVDLSLIEDFPDEFPVVNWIARNGNERRVQRMVGLIRQVQPAGPYRIAGWSFGGVLAYEIARQLLAHGQAVEFLGLIDAFCPDASGTEEATLPTPGEVLISLCGEACPTAQAPFAQLFHCYRSRQALPENLEVLSPEEAEAQCRSLATHDRAMERYRPEPIGMPVHLFSALEGELEAREARGPSLGWRTCVPEGLLRVWQIPGSHVSIMKPPRIHFLGECVTRVLADLDASRRGGVATAACDALLAEQEAGV